MVNLSRELLDRLEASIRHEAFVRRQNIEKQWRLPLEVRVRKGKAIGELCFAGRNEDNGNLMFTCSENESLFRMGDALIFHKNSPLDHDAVECSLESDDERYLEVSLGFGDSSVFESDPEGWIADEGDLDLSDLFLGALFDVAEKDIGRNRILPLLLGTLKPGVHINKYMAAYDAVTGAGFDASQAEAAALALASDLVYLIQGPPGTGKTAVIAHMTQALVSAGERVLITSFTHRAINNCLNKILDTDSALPVCKIGIHARTEDLRVKNFPYFSSSGFGKLEGGYAVGATPFATRSRRLGGVHFDTVIFDEASQVTLPIAILGMLVGDRYIFVGDDKQLPPVTVSRNTTDSLIGASIFGLLSGRGYETMLDVTYRMNGALTRWPSKTYYNHRLAAADAVKERKLQCYEMPSASFGLLNPEDAAVFADLRHKETRICSHHEAALLARLIVELIRMGLEPADIGVVTPYRRQVREIRRQLKRLLGRGGPVKNIVIDTVERMQGQEREVILVSLATSDPSFAEDLGHFFFQPNRLNVTITRARTKLIVVGSSEVLKATSDDPLLKSRMAEFRDFISHCEHYDMTKVFKWPEFFRIKF